MFTVDDLAVFITEIVVWKLRERVGGHQTGGKSGTGKKVSPTENGKFGADRRLPTPQSNHSKFVEEVLKEKDQKAKEKPGREQGRIKEHNKEDFCEISVSLSKVVERPLETKIHFFLGLHTSGQDMLFDIREPIRETEQRSQPNIKQEDRVGGWQQVCFFSTQRGCHWCDELG